MSSSLFRGVGHASLYSKFRPSPPLEFIQQILTFLKHKIEPPFKQALDIGCGTGQSTVVLAPHFQSVIGIDVSEAQIKLAKDDRPADNVEYRVSNGDDLPFKSQALDLITLSQAVHWFDTTKLFSEVNRVLKPNGIIAVYGYWIPLPKFEDENKTRKISELIANYLHEEQLGKYWNEERYIVQRRYADIHLPYNDCIRTNVARESKSSLADYIGYLSSWSAYQKLCTENSTKAVKLLEDVKKQFINILDTEKPEEQINLTLSTDNFMIMGRKPEA